MPRGVYKRHAVVRGGKSYVKGELTEIRQSNKAEYVTVKEPHVDPESGATSSHVAMRYDLIPPNGFRVAARNWTTGAAIHKPYNWRQGILSKDFITDRINHIQEHFIKLVHGRKTDDDFTFDPVDQIENHLGAIIWGAMFVAEVLHHSEESRKILFQILDVE